MTAAPLARIRTDASNPFAHQTMGVRIPGLIREVRQLNPDYPPSIQAALSRLADDLAGDAPIPMLDLPAPDYDDWLAAYRSHEGETWLHSEWFFAEMLYYRTVIQAVRWWETGRDPFWPKKMAEYAGEMPWRLLEGALAGAGSLEEQLSELLGFALWGNRIDLSYALAASHGAQVDDDDLLVDERPRAVEHLLRTPGAVHIITDNAGSELLMDLALVDGLMRLLNADVMLHVKYHPTYVSDTTAPDVRWLIEHLCSGERGRAAADLGLRLSDALESGRLRLAPDLYWHSSQFIGDLPARIGQLFQTARLVIVKGDANYRRLVGDVIWPATQSFSATVPLPVSLLALRTLKSDPVVGLPPGLAEQLDGIDSQWRVNGRRGVIQMNGL